MNAVFDPYEGDFLNRYDYERAQNDLNDILNPIATIDELFLQCLSLDDAKEWKSAKKEGNKDDKKWLLLSNRDV